MTYYLFAKFPPPVNGQSLCSKHLRNSFIIATKKELRCINRIVLKEKNIITKIISETISIFKLIKILDFRPDSSLIISLSSGLGSWFDIIILLFLLNFSKIKIYLWYHSRLKSQGLTFSQKIIDRISHTVYGGQRIYHIVLDEQMLTSRLNCHIARSNIVILDNSYIFLDSKIRFDQNSYPENPLCKSSLSFGYLSVLSDVKGFPLFVDSIVSLSSKYPDVIFNCLIAGPDQSKGLLDEFISYSNRFANINIKYLGLIGEEKYETFFPNIDYLLFPSTYKHEALPLTLIESISCGIIPISTDIGGIRSLIANPYIDNILSADTFAVQLNETLNASIDYAKAISYLQDKLRIRIDNSRAALKSL